MLEYAWQNDF